MKVPVSWLEEYVRPGLSVSELADRLTMTGTKVEAIEHHGVGETAAFVVGHVLEATQHPDADRLTVCRVDVGEAEPAQIVCGAPNVAAGQTVAVARPGAVMPDGTTLGKAKLRGVVSEGMILAEDELVAGRPTCSARRRTGSSLPTSNASVMYPRVRSCRSGSPSRTTSNTCAVSIRPGTALSRRSFARNSSCRPHARSSISPTACA